MLSPKHFFQRGFTVLPGTLSPELLAGVTEELERLAAPDSTHKGLHRAVRDDDGTVLVMNGIDKQSDMLFSVAREQKLVDIAEELLGKRVVPLHTEYFAKPAHCVATGPPHQDHVFYHEHFRDDLAVSLWIALEDVGELGGALEYGFPSPSFLIDHKRSAARDLDWELTDASPFAFTVAPVPAGGCAAHHSFVVHRSGPNLTTRLRRAIVFNYRVSEYRTWLSGRNARTAPLRS